MTTQEPQKGTMEEVELDFPYQDDNYWLMIDVSGIKVRQYPSPLEVKMLIHHQLQKAREEERERAIEIVKDELRTAPLEVQMTKGIVFASIVGRIRSELNQDISK